MNSLKYTTGSKYGICVDPIRHCSYNPRFSLNLSGVQRMRLVSIKLALLCVWLLLGTAWVLAQSTASNDLVIRNATVMTATHGNIKNGSVYIKDGKIAAV